MIWGSYVLTLLISTGSFSNTVLSSALQPHERMTVKTLLSLGLCTTNTKTACW